MMFLLWSVLACAYATATQNPPSRVVTIAQGPVRGFREPDADVYVFRSIPYATTPRGRDRYKAPLPPPTWTETFDAYDRGVRCPQGRSTTEQDCLIANIYVPDTQATNLPVLVLVHGGAFQFGFGEFDKAVALVNSKKIIAVNFNYRLGVHGFLCLGNEDVPGNAGMKDQVALLRWVQTNIAAFRGNASDVTIAGCSAGGVSVDLHRLSSSTDGLFNKVIAASGGNAGSFGIQHDPIANAKWFARELNFEDVEDISALTNFYTNSSLQLLLSRTDLAFNRHDSTVVWSPCVERDIGVERFLDEAPVNILEKGKHKQMPILYGFADKEGLMRLGSFDSWRVLMNNRFSDFLPGDLQFSSDEEREEVASRVRQFYFRDEPVNEGNILNFIDYFTDVLFGYSMLRSVKLNAEHGNSDIYLYDYSFTDVKTPLIPHTNVSGATHCDQYYAAMDPNGDETNITSEFRQMRETMRELFINFVTTGHPLNENSTLSSWAPADGNRNPHVNLDLRSTLRGPLLQERCRLWDGIYEAHYRTPIPPTDSASILKAFSLFWIFSLVLLFMY